MESNRADGVSILELFDALWHRRLTLIAVTAIACALGALYAMLAPSVYETEALIAPQEDHSAGGSGILSQFGGLGGLLASQMGSVSLDKLEVHMRSLELAEAVVREGNLLRGLFPSNWDDKAGHWKNGHPPTNRDGAEILQAKHIRIFPEPKRKMLRLQVTAGDSATVMRVINLYLEISNNQLRSKHDSETTENVQYLESRLMQSADPLVREKITGLIGVEIEKSMVSGARLFDLVDPPTPPVRPAGPNRRFIVLVSIIGGFLVGVFLSLLRFFVARIRQEWAKTGSVSGTGDFANTQSRKESE